jgi:hypothetical protein
LAGRSSPGTPITWSTSSTYGELNVNQVHSGRALGGLRYMP